MRHTVPETDALSPELRGRDAREDSDEPSAASASVGESACRTIGHTSTIDSSWLIRSSSWPTCWHRRLRRVAGGDDAVDPVVRPSDRADAQANGALALAKQLGRKPRDVADDVVAAADLTGKATLEVAGPGFINVTFDDGFLKEQLHSLEADDRLGVRNAPCSRACGRRLLGAQHRQGDAHRAPAHDRHRRRVGSHCSSSSATPSSARTTSATGARRSACSSSTSSTSARPRLPRS